MVQGSRLMRAYKLLILGLCLGPLSSGAGPKKVTLFHTNDLHSHFLPSGGTQNLGGLARLKTLLNQLRPQTEGSLLLDGGDWSEGSVFYYADAGVSSLRIMDLLGYDVVIPGNHDWLNGPDLLLNTVQRSGVRLKQLAANIDLGHYPRKKEFQEAVSPYVIREVNGVRVAVIGLITYELIWDKYFRPIEITFPLTKTMSLIDELKGKADVIVLLSHNSLFQNKLLAKIPGVDLVIGAHDHHLLKEPYVASQLNGKKAWVVEAGLWGHHLGRVDLSFENGKVQLESYKLYEVNSTLAEDPEVASRVQETEGIITHRMGPVFSDKIATSQVEIVRDLGDNPMAGLVTEAFMAKTGADFAIDQFGLIQSGWHEGEIHSAHAISSLPSLYDPQTEKSWNVQLLPIRGSVLQRLLSIVLLSDKWPVAAGITGSGLDVIYNPLFRTTRPEMFTLEDLDFLKDYSDRIPLDDPESSEAADRGLVIKGILIQGQPLKKERTYLMAMSTGMREVFEFVGRYVPNLIPLTGVKDSGVEQWRALAEYVKDNPVLDKSRSFFQPRIKTRDADLAVVYNDIQWHPTSNCTGSNACFAEISVTVRNQGMSESDSDSQISLFSNRNGSDTTREPAYFPVGQAQKIGKIPAQGSVHLKWKGMIFGSRGIYPITAVIRPDGSDGSQHNNQVTHWFKK